MKFLGLKVTDVLSVKLLTSSIVAQANKLVIDGTGIAEPVGAIIGQFPHVAERRLPIRVIPQRVLQNVDGVD